MPETIVVVPCFNEASRLDISRFKRFSSQISATRFVFVNDGSNDDTLAVLEALNTYNAERFRVHNLPRNSGKAEAVRQGVLQAFREAPDFVGYWDADLATPLDAIDDFYTLLQNRPNVHIIMGARVRLLGRKIERRPVRHYLGRIFATAASLTLGLPVYDTQCGAKLIRVSQETHSLFDEPFLSNWSFDVEILARFMKGREPHKEYAQNGIYEFPLVEWRDVEGSRVKPADFMRTACELGRIYYRYFLKTAQESSHNLEDQVARNLPTGSQPVPTSTNAAGDKEASS